MLEHSSKEADTTGIKQEKKKYDESLTINMSIFH